MVVYLITNKKNEHLYVGQTSGTITRRWREHVKWCNYPDRLGVLHKAIIKYGKESFSIETLHICGTKEEMDFVEMFYIELLNTKAPNGYNLTDGGSKGNIGYKHTEEAKTVMRAAKLGKKLSTKHCAALSKAGKGRKHSPEEIRNQVASRKLGKGFSQSEETRRRIREARARQVMKPVSEETRRKISIGIRAAKPWKHGTKTGRVNHKCNCEECIAWGKRHWQETKLRKGRVPIRKGN